MRTDYYSTKEKQCEIEIDRLKRISNKWLLVKLVFFFFAAYMVWLWIDIGGMLYSIIAIFAFAVYAIAVVMDNRVVGQRDYEIERKEVYDRELRAIKGEFGCYDGERYANEDHPYSGDVDIFGKNSLYHRINRTHTKVGENALATLLCDMAPYDETKKQYCDAVNELSNMNDFREEFMLGGYIDQLAISDNNIKPLFGNTRLKILTWILRGFRTLTVATIAYCTIGSIIAWPVVYAMGILGILFIIQLGITFIINNKTSKATRNADKLIKAYTRYTPLMQLFVSQHFSSCLLNEMLQETEMYISDKTEVSNMERIYAMRANPIMWMALNGLLLTDLSALLSFIRWTEKRLPLLPMMENVVGKLDSMVSCAQYNFNHPECCVAEPCDAFIVDARKCYHPFMKKSDTISNSMTINQGTTSIITGANMSGKSTFLRAIALNLIMAKCGLRVAADKFRFHPDAMLFTSMRIRDNISRGISYFQSEVLRISQLTDYIKDKPQCLIMLDEVLRGTNSDDKLHGTVRLLRFLSERHCTVVIATHDVAVASLEQEHPNIFHNYCFEIVLSNPPGYPYLLTEGVCKNKNATYLLEQILQYNIVNI